MGFLYENRKARQLYDVLETIEAGIVLTGAEVKSIRLGSISFRGSHITFLSGKPVVIGLHVSRYPFSALPIDPERSRALLLKKSEVHRLLGLSQQKGITLVPLKLYDHNRKVKVAIGVVRGKKQHDRREELRKRTIVREAEIALRGKE